MIGDAVVLLWLVSLGQLDPLTHLQTITQDLEHPARLAVSATYILVADPQADTIVRLDLAGNLLGTWSEPAGPLGVAVHPDGRIFVSRRADARVGVYDGAFNLLRFVGDGDPAVNFIKPTDLTVDAGSGRICVTDSGGDRIYVFNSDESLALAFGVRGSPPGQFKYPSAIAVDALNQRLVIADQDNYRVQVFSLAGDYLFKFGNRIKYLPGGGSQGWLPRIAGLAVDGSGNIYVSDALMGTLQIFDQAGSELGKVVDYGTGPGQLRTPGDVALTADGRVLVANSTAGGVEVYAQPSPAPLRALGGQVGEPGDGGATATSPAAMTAPQLFTPTLVGANLIYAPAVPSSNYDPPHILDDVSCNRCHNINGQPGEHVGTIEGQEVLCLSCHTGAGQGDASLFRPTANLGMSHAWGVPAVNETYGSAGPTPGGPLEQFLEGGLINCSTCHDQHSNDDGQPYLRLPAAVICQHCHTQHVVHTPAGGWQPGCLECHAAHDHDDRNLALVGSPVYNQTLGQDKPVVLTARTGPNSFADGNPASIDGICEVCHTATTYHRHDGSGAPHNAGQDCLVCHPHQAGFLPVGGGCTGCHASAQDNGDGIPPGGRRAVVGEFPVGDAHAHYGTDLDDNACGVCHSTGTHMDGYVELIDPDDGSIYRFVYAESLTTEPDVSNFCAGCHDEDGAARLAAPFDPFGNGNMPSEVASRFQGSLQWYEWYGDFCFGQHGTLRGVNSHHDISDADQVFSGARIECLNCHGAHSAGSTQPLIDPYDRPAPWSGGSNDFCLACHQGGGGPDAPALPPGVVGPAIALRGIESCDYTAAPWYVNFTWTHSAHGLDSKRGWNGYSGAPSHVLDCVVCHDPHGSYTASNAAGNPYMIRDFVDGTSFVDDGYRPGAHWTGPPWDTLGTAREVIVPVSGLDVGWGDAQGLCSVCHATWFPSQPEHEPCTACQTCHAHGGLWGEHDWVSPPEDTACP